MPTDPIDHQFRSFIENAYSSVPRDDLEKVIDNVNHIVDLARDRKNSIREILDQTTKMIFRLFSFGEITIGLKDREDGFYKYEAFFGLRKEVEQNFRKLRYNLQDMTSNERFPHMSIGRMSNLNPVEGLPENEEPFFNRPYSLKGKRASFTEFREGDYIDVFMYGQGKEIVGWIELSSPKDGKMPSRGTLKWLEMIADVTSLIIQTRWSGDDAVRRK